MAILAQKWQWVATMVATVAIVVAMVAIIDGNGCRVCVCVCGGWCMVLGGVVGVGVWVCWGVCVCVCVWVWVCVRECVSESV